MLYGIQINQYNREMIGNVLNNGVVPELEQERTVFIFSDDPDFVPEIKPVREIATDRTVYIGRVYTIKE